jgi:hypothetical protein
MPYCTVCDNNNGNCTVHNTTKLLAIEHQHIPFQNKPILGETLGEIDPDFFDGFALALPEAMREAKAQGKEPPSFLVILNKFRSKDLRRGLVAVNSLLEAWGKDFFSEARSEPKE